MCLTLWMTVQIVSDWIGVKETRKSGSSGILRFRNWQWPIFHENGVCDTGHARHLGSWWQELRLEFPLTWNSCTGQMVLRGKFSRVTTWVWHVFDCKNRLWRTTVVRRSARTTHDVCNFCLVALFGNLWTFASTDLLCPLHLHYGCQHADEVDVRRVLVAQIDCASWSKLMGQNGCTSVRMSRACHQSIRSLGSTHTITRVTAVQSYSRNAKSISFHVVKSWIVSNVLVQLRCENCPSTDIQIVSFESTHFTAVSSGRRIEDDNLHEQKFWRDESLRLLKIWMGIPWKSDCILSCIDVDQL